MIFYYNKKGGEKLLSIWWFSILAIVGISIVAAILIHYSQNIDVKELEASALSDKVYGCVVNNGILISSFLSNDFDIFKECGLASKAFEIGSYFILKITLKDLNGKEIKSLVLGDASIEKDCAAVWSGEVKAKYFPRCISANAKVSYYDDNSLPKTANLNIFTGSKQMGGKVPLLK